MPRNNSSAILSEALEVALQSMSLIISLLSLSDWSEGPRWLKFKTILQSLDLSD